MKIVNALWIVALVALDVPYASAVGGLHLDAILVPQDVTARQVKEFLIGRIPPLNVPETREAWVSLAQDLRKDFLDTVVLQGVPESWTQPETSIVWGDTIDRGAYRIRKLRYEALPGLWIPATLYEPTDIAGKVPAVLNVNGHAGPGKAHEDEQIRCINLALRGMLALHPEWYSFGELNNPEYAHENLAYLDLVGVRGLSVFYLALKRGLDVLAMDPHADPSRIAMTGLSGGGWQTALLSALDDRIDLIVPVAGHGAMAPRIEHVSDIGDLEQAPADMLSMADYTHLTAWFAPRPTLLIYNAQDECCFQPEDTLPALYDVVLPVFELFSAGDRFEKYVNEDPGTHNYALDNRQQFYRFLNKHFLPPDERIDDEIPCQDELLALEALRVGIPDDNETFVTLAKAKLAAIERPAVPPVSDPGFADWQRERRAVLERIVRPYGMALRGDMASDARDAGLRSTTYVLTNDEWSLPAVHLVPQDAVDGRVTIVIADEGMASMGPVIERLIAEKRQVVAVDPVFMGRTQPHESKGDRLAMVMNMTGQPALGVQAAQLVAVCQWVRDAGHISEIAIYAKGCNAGLASLVAIAASPGTAGDLTLEDMPVSLGALIETGVSYAKYPAVFCYGLLEQFDVSELEALCHPATVERHVADPMP